MGRHSPAPWAACEAATYRAEIVAADKTVIARLTVPQIRGATVAERHALADANEALIAAAPELLAALRGLESRYEPGVFCDHAAAPCNRCDSAAAALAKATGLALGPTPAAQEHPNE